MNTWVVLKFGGTSVSGLTKWQSIVDIIKHKNKQGFRVLLVHSAASGLTNLLTEKINQGRDVTADFTARLKSLAEELSVDLSLARDCLDELDQLNQLNTLNLHQQADWLSLGERCTHRLIMAFLNRQLEATSLNPKEWLISTTADQRSTESQVLSAKCLVRPNPEKTNSLNSDCCVMPGFFAADSAGRTVLLGRGGSDTTAAYMAVTLSAKQLEIWTDVHGMFTTAVSRAGNSSNAVSC